MNHATQVRAKPENPLVNIIFNIALPVFILNHFSKKWGDSGPLIALILALLLPIGYGAYDYFTRRQHNYISILGFINVAFTGGFALLKLNGIWFAVKEAFFPLLIGVAIYVMNLKGKPLLQTLFWNDNVFHTQLIESKIQARHGEHRIPHIFRRATFLFSLSFFVSAFLNFALASSIFMFIDPALPETRKSEILNEQIAQMTWMGYIVIALPMMIFMAFLLWYVLRQLKESSGLLLEEMMAPHTRSKTEDPHSS